MILKLKGFTLIELLIVVAIIAILAAIAVPNFLEAQTRSKVARVKGDLRTISIGLEAYAVEYSKYPPDQDNDPTSPRTKEGGFSFLTSPVAYLSTVSWNDPFSAPLDWKNTNADDIAPIYQMGSGVDVARRSGTVGLPPINAYVLFSLGPDKTHDMTNDDWPYQCNIKALYDPTNGTVSSGEIVRFGGNYLAGDWKIGGLDHNLWQPRQTYP